MQDTIRTILEKLSLIESDAKITPVDVKPGLNAQQRAAPQMPALFKNRDISPVLSGSSDPQHPSQGYFVGGESAGQVTSEDLLSKQHNSLIDYLERIEADRQKPDSDLAAKPADRELGKRPRDRDILPRAAREDVTQEEPTVDTPAPVQQNPIMAETAVRTLALEDGSLLSIFGDDEQGFEIRRGERRLPSRFGSVDHAVMAVEMYRARRSAVTQDDSDQDYLEER
jgi:hypothetical protein